MIRGRIIYSIVIAAAVSSLIISGCVSAPPNPSPVPTAVPTPADTPVPTATPKATAAVTPVPTKTEIPKVTVAEIPNEKKMELGTLYSCRLYYRDKIAVKKDDLSKMPPIKANRATITKFETSKGFIVITVAPPEIPAGCYKELKVYIDQFSGWPPSKSNFLKEDPGTGLDPEAFIRFTREKKTEKIFYRIPENWEETKYIILQID